MNTELKRIFITLTILLITGYVVMKGAGIALFAISAKDSGSTETVVVEITRGQNINEIAQSLSSRSVISDTTKFVRLGRLARKLNKIKAGEYKLSASMSPLQIYRIITSGVSIGHLFTVREGQNMYEIADNLQNKGFTTSARFLSLCKSPNFMTSIGFPNPPPPSLEGYLFPDTYSLNKQTAIEEIVKRMVKRFQNVWTEEHQRLSEQMGMTQHEVITLASVIEKETGVPYERPVISSVFHNRLKKRMRLQSDPTTIYGIWEKFQGNIHKEDLHKPTPYNTYTISGLPIGPIANPGKEAIEAALHPASSDYLFFVSHNDGTHEFTRSFREHSMAVKKFQLDRKAREGKSWRDYRKQQQQP